MFRVDRGKSPRRGKTPHRCFSELARFWGNILSSIKRALYDHYMNRLERNCDDSFERYSQKCVF